MKYIRAIALVLCLTLFLLLAACVNGGNGDGTAEANTDVADPALSRVETEPSMAALIAELAGIDGLKKVVFSEGVYRFSDTLAFRGLSDLYICGETEDTAYTFLMTAAAQGYLIAMDSTPGNFARTGNDFIGTGYRERTVTYTVGTNGVTP